MPRIALIPGDGVGPEVMDAVVPLLEVVADHLNIPMDLRFYEAGDETKRKIGVALPDETFQGVLKADATLMVAIGETAREVILPLRQKLDLYANLRPARSYPVPKAVPGFDLTIVRENTEDLYIMSGWSGDDAAVDLRVITKRGSERICRFGYEYARRRGKERVYVVHKANVLEGCRLFRRVCSQVASEEGFEYREMYVDSAAMRIATDRPFDVIITTNMFGDILSDLAAAFIGGLGMYPSANLGEGRAIFEPVHGTAPELAGRNLANPMATMLSASMMLDWLGYGRGARLIEDAVRRACELGFVTPDVGGSLGTREVGQRVLEILRSFL
ncbi:MAG: isocitrate/isopropylmalate dehydrogenase family protein [Candidatus Korarchaeota archaeon NZ13-K]|nr:MAG: isocitrate/isopropylmalate dehydrogenase family protein [Candidatus Korarchaeota archaeon NZ13-K]